VINDTNKEPIVKITGDRCPNSGAVFMIALSKGTSKYSLNLSQPDGDRGPGEATGAAGDAERLEDAILLSIYRDS